MRGSSPIAIAAACYTTLMLYVRARRWVLMAIAAALAHAPLPARAGIVNVQSILTAEAEEGFSGAVSGSIDWRTGSTDLLLLSAAPVARYRQSDHLIIGIVRGELGRTDGQRIIARTFEHLRYRYQLRDWILAEVFTQHEYDDFRRLRLRALLGAGPKVDLFRGEHGGIGLGLAYMLEYEQLQDDDEVDAGRTDLAHRLSSYLVGTYDVDERLQLVETLYAQPRLTDASDLRLLSDSSLIVALSKAFSVTTTFSLSWDTETPASIVELETALKSAIAYTF